MLYNAAGDRGIALRWHRQELPCLTVWRNTAALEDGYVTGLEPATNFPNLKTFERQQGRVRLLPPGARCEFTWSIEVFDSAAGVSKMAGGNRRPPGAGPPHHPPYPPTPLLPRLTASLGRARTGPLALCRLTLRGQSERLQSLASADRPSRGLPSALARGSRLNGHEGEERSFAGQGFRQPGLHQLDHRGDVPSPVLSPLSGEVPMKSVIACLAGALLPGLRLHCPCRPMTRQKDNEDQPARQRQLRGAHLPDMRSRFS